MKPVQIGVEILFAIFIVLYGGFVWTQHCHRMNKSNADWLLDTPWQHWKDLNPDERQRIILTVFAAALLVVISQWLNR